MVFDKLQRQLSAERTGFQQKVLRHLEIHMQENERFFSVYFSYIRKMLKMDHRFEYKNLKL